MDKQKQNDISVAHRVVMSVIVINHKRVCFSATTKAAPMSIVVNPFSYNILLTFADDLHSLVTMKQPAKASVSADPDKFPPLKM